MRGFFVKPVDLEDVPDYFEYIQHPICIDDISAKISSGSYTTFSEFIGDVEQIGKNAILYNKEDTVYAQAGKEFMKQALPFLAKASHQLKALAITGSESTNLNLIKHLMPTNNNLGNFDDQLQLSPVKFFESHRRRSPRK